MTRILRPGPRPIIAFGVMFAILLCLPILLAFQGKWIVAAQIGGILLVMYIAISFYVSRGRILVTNDYVAYQPPFGSEQRVAFRDIEVSIANVLAEPQHPYSLEIYRIRNQRPALTILLKAFRQDEVVWLISLPQLKVRR
jgi:hypothetical protein